MMPLLAIGGLLLAASMGKRSKAPGRGGGPSPGHGGPAPSGRSLVLSALPDWVPAELGEPRFDATLGPKTGPRSWAYYSLGPPEDPLRYGTTCGVWVAFLLELLGAPAVMVNRGPAYRIGEHLMRVVEGAKKVGAWREGFAGIKPGDIYVVATPPKGVDAHIGFFLDRSDGWVFTADAGQPGAAGAAQAAAYVARAEQDGKLSGPEGAWPFRPVLGYVDMDAAMSSPLARPRAPALDASGPSGSGPGRAWRTRRGLIQLEGPAGWYTPTLGEPPVGALQWEGLARSASKLRGVPLPWVLGTIHVESGGNPVAVSPAGALGLMQIMPQFVDVSPVNLIEPGVNVDVGSTLLAKSFKAGLSLPEAASIYNAGPGADGKPKPSESSPWGMAEQDGHIDKIVAASNWVTLQMRPPSRAAPLLFGAALVAVPLLAA